MIRLVGRSRWSLAALVGGAVLALALPAAAQVGTGRISGKVIDDQGKPVEGAMITMESDSGRHYSAKTDKKGEYSQIGVLPGGYKVSAAKGPLTQSFDIQFRPGSTGSGGATVNFQLVPGAVGVALTPELKKALDAGLAASKSGDYDGAITQFNAAVGLAPQCNDCYYQLGAAYSQKKDYANAETAFKKAIEIKPDYADAYNGLANIYNAQRRFDDAAAASAKATQFAGGGAAGGGGNADALYNQGVILWNSGKVAEAKKAFEDAIAANPNHAEAHYQLGMALVNGGDLPGAAKEFNIYLSLAPLGPNAAQAKALVAQLPKE